MADFEPVIIFRMKIRAVALLSGLLILAACFGLALTAQAGASAQGVPPTNTADPATGNIYYIVPAGDNCYHIAAMYNTTVDQIMQLNNMATCAPNAGQKLLVGSASPATSAAPSGPLATAGPATVTPTPFAGTTEICVLLYNDVNGDALRQADEPVIAGGAVSVTETTGKFSKTLQTVINADPNANPGVCFTAVPEGNYNVGVAIPDNYNATTKLTDTFDVKAGDIAQVSFGAQLRDSGAAQPSGGNQGGGGPSPLIGFFGGFLLLGGLGLGYYALRLRTPQSKLKRSGLLRR